MSKKNSKSNPDTIVKNQAKVLIIDDERLLRQSIKKILEKTGFYVETAMDYESAKKNIESLQFDLLLVDIVLPKISGIDLIRKLREEHDLTSAVIFITGEPNLKTCIDAMRVGAIDYLEKPVSRNVLIESIKRSLVHYKRRIQIIQDEEVKPITLDASFLNSTEECLSSEVSHELEISLAEIHDALLRLKKKYGVEFNEEQKTLLNVIAQNNSSMRKIISKLED